MFHKQNVGNRCILGPKVGCLPKYDEMHKARVLPKAAVKIFRRLTSVNRFDSPFCAGYVIQLKVSSQSLILLRDIY